MKCSISWYRCQWVRLGQLLAVVGLGATFAMLGTGNKDRALFAYLWAFEYVLSIALGAPGAAGPVTRASSASRASAESE